MKRSFDVQHQGSAIFSEAAWTEIARAFHFTRRELQMVRGVFDDKTEFAIAGDLGISPHTVHTYLGRLRHKLNVVDRVGLVVHVMHEFLQLTTAAQSPLPPACHIHAAGLCNRHD